MPLSTACGLLHVVGLALGCLCSSCVLTAGQVDSCIVMDEVDGMSAGDRGGMAELIQLIKKTKVGITVARVSRFLCFP
jgi:hypothetical protein